MYLGYVFCCTFYLVLFVEIISVPKIDTSPDIMLSLSIYPGRPTMFPVSSSSDTEPVCVSGTVAFPPAPFTSVVLVFVIFSYIRVRYHDQSVDSPRIDIMAARTEMIRMPVFISFTFIFGYYNIMIDYNTYR